MAKKLNKTETYIKQHQNRKDGIFLPTLSQYQKMDADTRKQYQLAIRSLDSKGYINRAKGFAKLQDLTHNLSGKRAMKAFAATMNITTSYSSSYGGKHHEHIALANAKGEFQLIRRFQIFSDATKKMLTVNPMELREQATSFDVYNDGYGHFIEVDTAQPALTVDPRTGKSRRGAFMGITKSQAQAEWWKEKANQLGQVTDTL